MAALIVMEVYNDTTSSWDAMTKVGNTYTYNWGQLGEDIHQLRMRARNTGDKTAKSMMVRETADARSYGSLSLTGASWNTAGQPLTLGNIEPSQTAEWFVKLEIPLGALIASGLGYNMELYNY